MRAGTEAALARVVCVFGGAHPHHAYLFANRRANRMKVLVHDGIGVGSPHAGSIRASSCGPGTQGTTCSLTHPQLVRVEVLHLALNLVQLYEVFERLPQPPSLLSMRQLNRNS